MRTIGKLTASVATTAAIGLTLAACSSSSTPSSKASGGITTTAAAPGCPTPTPSSGVAAPPGFQVCLFAAASTPANHPDNIVVSGPDVFVGWQNITAKDGSDTKTSTIAEYTTSGKPLHSWSVIGHTDGMRQDPATHLLWVMCNEDGKPRLYTIDPMSGAAATPITLPPTPHGGGFDDVLFINGMALIDASSPTLNKAGVNVFPALYKVTLSGTKAVLTPLLKGNAQATTINTPVTKVSLNLTDPDSMTIGPNGELVLTSQADQETLFITGLGTKQQSVKVLKLGDTVDDTVFAPQSKGCLLIADNSSGVFSICSSVWVPGAAYSAAPNDGPVIGFVGTQSLSSGQIQPIIVGVSNPHGMGFIPR